MKLTLTEILHLYYLENGNILTNEAYDKRKRVDHNKCFSAFLGSYNIDLSNPKDHHADYIFVSREFTSQKVNDVLPLQKAIIKEALSAQIPSLVDVRPPPLEVIGRFKGKDKVLNPHIMLDWLQPYEKKLKSWYEVKPADEVIKEHYGSAQRLKEIKEGFIQHMALYGFKDELKI